MCAGKALGGPLQPRSSKASDEVSSMPPWGPDSDLCPQGPCCPSVGRMTAPPTGQHVHVHSACPR